MRYFNRILSLLLLLALPGVCLAAGAEPRWIVGFGRAAVTLDQTALEAGEYYMAGYNNAYPAVGVLDEMQARALVLDDGSGEGGILLLAVDCVGLSSVDIGAIRDRLAPLVEETGLRAVHVISTHTHAGVDTLGLWGPVAENGVHEGLLETVADAAETAAREACANRREGRLYYGKAFVPKWLLRDSRDPQVMDRVLTCLRFAPDDGSAGVRLYHFSAHAEALRSENNLVSADYPGVLGRKVQEATGDEFLFVPGAIGGLVMTEQQHSDVYKSLEITGDILAQAALSIENEEELEPRLIRRTTEVDLPLENESFAVMQFLGVLRSGAIPFDSGTGLGLRTRMSYLEIGNLPVVLVPGELFPELATGVPEHLYFHGTNPDAEFPKPYSEILGTDRFLVIGLADDEIGYIVPPTDFYLNETAPWLENAYDSNGRRHYEETNSVGPATAEILSETLEKLVDFDR